MTALRKTAMHTALEPAAHAPGAAAKPEPRTPALRAAMALLAATVVLSSSCQMSPQVWAEVAPLGASPDTLDASAAAEHAAPTTAVRWYLWRAAFAAQPVIAPADDAPSASAAPSRGAKP